MEAEHRFRPRLDLNDVLFECLYRKKDPSFHGRIIAMEGRAVWLKGGIDVQLPQLDPLNRGQRKEEGGDGGCRGVSGFPCRKETTIAF